MSFLNDFLQQISTGDDVKDFAHATKTFVDGGMRLHPKHSFSYHVFFDIMEPGNKGIAQTDIIEAGMMVKNVDLPKFNIDTKKYNSYNRTNIVQTKINYDPITLQFHDDMANVVRDLWYAYYNYYYQDAQQVESVYSGEYKYAPSIPVQFGYSNSAYLPFFNAIRIYQMHQKQFSEYTLINPTITNWSHGSHTAGSSDPVDHQMTVQFETVKYATGYVSGDSPKGFGSLHYDQSPSPLTPAGGGTNSIAGPGGLLDTVGSIADDLASGNISGAAFKGIRAAKNFKGADFNQIASSEFKTGIKDVLAGKNPAQRFYIPTPKQAGGTGTSSAEQYPEP